MIPVGTIVSLIDYKRHNDWRRHGDEAGVIEGHNTGNNSYSNTIRWRNGDTSHADDENIVIVVKESLAGIQALIQSVVSQIKENSR